MLFEFSVIPVGGDAHLSGVIAEVVGRIEASGLPYQLTPAATCIEGDWDAVMPVLRECHAIARRHSPHVVTLLKIEDDAGETNKLARNLRSVEEKAGHPLAIQPASSQPHEAGLA
ncbi:MAG TPA: MTH1187 family thiamine-binding protein [Planctomycetaceae bacterium]